MSDAGAQVSANLTELVSVLITGTWLVALFTGQEWWLPFMLFGHVVIVPVTALLVGDQDTVTQWWSDEDHASAPAANESSDESALQTLRDRYARGELTNVVLHARLSRHRGRDPAEEFLVDGVGYFTAVALTDLRGGLNYADHNTAETLFRTYLM